MWHTTSFMHPVLVKSYRSTLEDMLYIVSMTYTIRASEYDAVHLSNYYEQAQRKTENAVGQYFTFETWILECIFLSIVVWSGQEPGSDDACDY